MVAWSHKKPMRAWACVQWVSGQAALSQYPELKGLLMRSAKGDTSTSLSVGIFSPLSLTSMLATQGPAAPTVLVRSPVLLGWFVQNGLQKE